MVLPEIIQKIPEGWDGAAVLIQSTEGISGVFYVFAPSVDVFTEEGIKLLGSLSEILGTALHRLKLYEETQKNLEQITTLQKIDRAISGSTDFDVMLNILLEGVKAVLGVDALGILIFN